MSREAKALMQDVDTSRGTSPVTTTSHAVGARVEARYRATVLGKMGTKWFAASVRAVHGDGSYDVLYDDGDEENGVLAQFVRAPKLKATAPQAPPPPGETAVLDEEDDDGPISSRNKRKVKSTTVMVDGQRVKRSNMYDMEGGERSVWDQELGGGPSEYVDRPARAAAAAAPAPKKPKAAAAPKQLSAAERERLERRNVISRARDAAKYARAGFLQPHRAVLERFGANVPSAAAAAGAPAFRIDPAVGQPAEVGVPLRDYQLDGLRWLVAMHTSGTSAILADEMGLGKTLQTIALLAHLKFEKGVDGPHLVVCPLSVLSSWMSEFKRFCPQLRAVKLHSSDAEERTRLLQSIQSLDEYDVVVTTYEMAKSPNVTNILANRSWWRYLVVDEGHVLKNPLSQNSLALNRFHFAHALLLTGTPLQNNLSELWALLHFLYGDLFPTSDAFDAAFVLNGSQAQVDDARLADASSLLRPFMLRRTKGEVEKGLPPKLETTINCPLSEMQLFWYKRLLLRESALLGELEREAGAAAETGGDWRKLNSLLMQLRKCCNHPFLFPGVEPDDDDGSYGEQLVAASGKMSILDRLLTKLKEGGHRVVLFSQFTSTLDLLEELLLYRGHKYCRLDGSTNRVQRTVDINAFNMLGSPRFVFLMSTRAGGLGINLQTADTVILYDSDWNPQVDIQAMGRVHRIGQTKVVHAYRLVTPSSVEERIVQRAEKKLYLDQMVNRGSTANAEALEELGESEMRSMLRFGTGCCFASEEPPTDAELASIIDRTRTEEASVGALKGGGAKTAADFDAEAPMLDLRKLQGETYGDAAAEPKDFRTCKASMADIGAEWQQARGKRQSKSRFTTERVAGVGEVNVLRENDYGLGEEMPNAERERGAFEKPEGRQVAGRDFAHEATCLHCWRGPGDAAVCPPVGKKPKGSPSKREAGGGGTLRGCDWCPAAYHLECVGMSAADAKGFGMWACPHHQCGQCGRKAAAAGGLLFRCAMCPRSFCEDHLPAEAIIMGECERFLALGARHPKQGCYILCKTPCVAKAAELGLDCGEASASAAAILGATGVDTTAAPAAAGKKRAADGAAALAATQRDQRSDWERLRPRERSALDALLRKPPKTLGAATAGFLERATEKKKQPGAHFPTFLVVTSTLDLLHDFCFDTNLYDTNQKDGDEYRGEESPLVKRLNAAAGAAAGRAGGAEPTQEQRDEAAARYLRLVRQLEGTKGPTLARIASLLKVQRLLDGGGIGGGYHGNVQLKDASSSGRKKLAPAIALFLALPSEEALVLDERAAAKAAAEAGDFEKAGDPGFLVLGTMPAYCSISPLGHIAVNVPKRPQPAVWMPLHRPPPPMPPTPSQEAQWTTALDQGKKNGRLQVPFAMPLAGPGSFVQRCELDDEGHKLLLTLNPTANPHQLRADAVVNVEATQPAAPCHFIGHRVRIDGMTGVGLTLNGRRAVALKYNILNDKYTVKLTDGAWRREGGGPEQSYLKMSAMKLDLDADAYSGAVVRIVGLSGSAALNNQLAKAERFDAKAGRVEVEVSGGRRVAVKLHNLVLVEDQTSKTPPTARP